MSTPHDLSHLAQRLSAVIVAAPLVLSACDLDTGPEDIGAEDPDASTPLSDEEVDELLDELPEPSLPAELLDYGHALPAHFDTQFVRNADNTPADNPITDAGATLGRVLFWDRRLSQTGAVACGSCHDPAFAFSDDAVLSEGFAGDLTGRNSMPLINARYYARGAMFWDERAASVEEQVLMPIQDSAEMGLSLEELVERVGATDYYAPLFTAAFGDGEVTSERISLALAQFVRSIVADDAPWDRGVAMVEGDIAQDFPNYSVAENRGKDLFFGRARCSVCHMPANPLAPPPPGPGGANAPTDNLALWYVDPPANNGLDAPNDTDDFGIGDITGDPRDTGKFKSPSLRNVAQTAPYMHDGRFATLAEVIEHYDTGVVDSPALDPRLRDPQTGMAQRLNLNAAERGDLEAFLRTLTDPTLADDPRWSDPF